MNPTIIEELMWRGYTPPQGTRRTTCPHCSAGRKKSKEKCVTIRLRDDLGLVTLLCHHCGIEDSFPLQ
jgi:RNase P subunit RPR2